MTTCLSLFGVYFLTFCQFNSYDCMNTSTMFMNITDYFKVLNPISRPALLFYFFCCHFVVWKGNLFYLLSFPKNAKLYSLSLISVSVWSLLPFTFIDKWKLFYQTITNRGSHNELQFHQQVTFDSFIGPSGMSLQIMWLCLRWG